ncbi:MAG: lipoprotein [Gammaproteobacteria bacterium]|nr:lipoprotein [Gammaproteobacteria bacterium]
MPALKRIILFVFLSLLVACGQKGALTLSDENKPEQKKTLITQPSKTEAQEVYQ